MQYPIPTKNCPVCKKEMSLLARIIKDDKGNTKRTKTEITVCENPNCCLFINVNKVRNWEKI